jgi:hypothetical protein
MPSTTQYITQLASQDPDICSAAERSLAILLQENPVQTIRALLDAKHIPIQRRYRVICDFLKQFPHNLLQQEIAVLISPISQSLLYRCYMGHPTTPHRHGLSHYSLFNGNSAASSASAGTTEVYGTADGESDASDSDDLPITYENIGQNSDTTPTLTDDPIEWTQEYGPLPAIPPTKSS